MLLPLAVPLAMRPVFRAASRRFGPRRGYQAGFAVYWVLCWGAAGAIVGPRRLARLWQPSRHGREPGAVRFVLALPPVGALATQWLPSVQAAGPAAVAVAAAVGVTNALAEEALWRGVPVAMFPEDVVRGWLWPAVGFTAWHLVPLSMQPGSKRRRRAQLLAGAALIGLGYGWVAQRTGSLTAVSACHAVTDSCGLRAARMVWLG